MGLVIPEDYAQIIMSITHALDANPWAITWGANRGSEGNLQEMVDEISNASRTHLKTVTDAGYTWGPCTMRVTDGGEPLIYVATGTSVGTSTATDALPQNSALLIHKRTGHGGIRGRGRCYIPGVQGESVGEGGRLEDAYRGDVQDAMDAWLTALQSDPLETVGMWLLHSTGETAVPVPYEITSLQCDAVIATQRRRLRR